MSKFAEKSDAKGQRIREKPSKIVVDTAGEKSREEIERIDRALTTFMKAAMSVEYLVGVLDSLPTYIFSIHQVLVTHSNSAALGGVGQPQAEQVQQLERKFSQLLKQLTQVRPLALFCRTLPTSAKLSWPLNSVSFAALESKLVLYSLCA